MIDWWAFVTVLVASLVGACVMVSLFAVGLRLLSSAGRPVHVEPADFADAITVVSKERALKEAKRIRKARERSQLTATQRRWRLVAAQVCFVLCAAIGLFGIYLVIPAFH